MELGYGLLFGAGSMDIQKAIFKVLMLGVVTVWVAAFTLPDDKLHVVVCDVGQGDAILVTYGTNQMLIDGGPNDNVLGCLGRHMPFYDRKIEVVILTHPQADHLNGLVSVAERYNIQTFIKGEQANETKIYRELMSKGLRFESMYLGDEIKMGEVRFKVVWPTREFTSPSADADPPLLISGEGRVNLNDYSIGGILSYGEFDVLLTGDADERVEDDMLVAGRLREVEVLKVPHHGSKTGMTEEWLEMASPELAIISVGRNNRYGHPREEAIKLLRDRDIKVLRTDEDGDVEIITDGKNYWIGK